MPALRKHTYDADIVGWAMMLNDQREERGVSKAVLLCNDINMRSIALNHGVSSKEAEYVKTKIEEHWRTNASCPSGADVQAIFQQKR